MDGLVEWTEIGRQQGLDHLAMLSPIEALYQSLLPGFTSVTTRLRNYSFYAWCLVRYAEKLHDGSLTTFQDFMRRAEALYALAAAQYPGETGVAGATFCPRDAARGGSRHRFSP